MASKLKQGSSLSLVKTKGRQDGSFDLYNLEGLSLGKVAVIYEALKQYALQGHTLADEILAVIGTPDDRATIDGQ